MYHTPISIHSVLTVGNFFKEKVRSPTDAISSKFTLGPTPAASL